MRNIDLHVHSNYSDGSETTEELVKLALHLPTTIQLMAISPYQRLQADIIQDFQRMNSWKYFPELKSQLPTKAVIFTS